MLQSAAKHHFCHQIAAAAASICRLLLYGSYDVIGNCITDLRADATIIFSGAGLDKTTQPHIASLVFRAPAAQRL
jgi:hypothetical protein